MVTSTDGAKLSKMETTGIALNDAIFKSRIVLGVAVALLLTLISIAFNVYTGTEMATDQYSTTLYGFGFAAIAVSGLVIITICVFGNANILVKAIGMAFLVYIITLDIFASLTFQITNDTKNASTGDQARIIHLEKNIAQEETRIAMWNDKLGETKKFHKEHDKSLKQATDDRDAYQEELDKLKEKYTPPILMVFNKLYSWVPRNVDNDKPFTLDEFKTLIRGAWSVMLALLPYMMTLLIFSEIKATTKIFIAGRDESGDSPEKKHDAGANSSEFESANQPASTNESGTIAPWIAADMPAQSMAKHDPVDFLTADLLADLFPVQDTKREAEPVQSVQDIEQPGPVPAADPVRSNVHYLDPDHERGPDRTKSDRTGPKKGTRATGLDREVAQEIYNHLAHGTGSISENTVREHYGIGKSLLRSIYEKAQADGYITKEGPGKPWKRVKAA